MALDDELKKAKEDLEKRPPFSREDYEKGLKWMRERFGEKGFVGFNRETALANAANDVRKLVQFMEELRDKGVVLCQDCEIGTMVNFLEKLDADKTQ